MAVELGAVHAGELSLAVHGQAAAAAHAGAVDHDAVHVDHRVHAVLLRDLTYELHHRQGTDADAGVILLALGLGLLQQLLELHGGKALLAVGAVVGHHVEILAAGAHLVLEDDDALRAEASHDVDVAAALKRALGLRPGDRAAGAAAHDDDLVHVVKLGGIAERAHDVRHIVALVHAGEQGGRAADALHDHGHVAGLAVEVGDRDRHALAELVHTEHEELARLRPARHERRVEGHAEHVIG